MRPIAQRGFDLSIIDHREAVIAAPGKERQEMHTAEGVWQAGVEKGFQCFQRWAIAVEQAVAIGDQPLVSLAP